MRIIGLDPSLVNTGAVVLEGEPGAWGLLKMELFVTKNGNDGISIKERVRKNHDDYFRASALYTWLSFFCDKSDLICLELPQIGGATMQARSMWTSGISLGLLAALSGDKMLLNPSDIKNVVGNPSASKEDVCKWAYSIYPYAPWPSRKIHGAQVFLKNNHHISDALAAAVCGLQKKNIWLSSDT